MIQIETLMAVAGALLLVSVFANRISVFLGIPGLLIFIGIGMLAGGYIAEISTFDKAYLFGACLTVVSMLYFNLKVTPHYHQNKLR